MKKKVVVIGGGFVGSNVAKDLEKDFHVTLIDSKNYFEFTPSILRVIVNPTHLKKIQSLHDHYLFSSKIFKGCVNLISDNFILFNSKKIYFDYLVIASGSSYSLPIKDQNSIIPTRAKKLRKNFSKLENSKEILIVGGGLVGVELAAEITCKYPLKKITLIHSGKELIPRHNKNSRKFVYNFLNKRGVLIVLDDKVLEKKGDFVLTSKGKKIKSDLNFICTGIKSNSGFMKKKFSDKLNKKEQIKVNSFLQLEGLKNIFAGGDVTNILEEKTAQNAINHSKTICSNIRNLEEKKELKEYLRKEKPIVISLGERMGVFEYRNIVLTGRIPALVKDIIERSNMKRYF